MWDKTRLVMWVKDDKYAQTPAFVKHLKSGDAWSWNFNGEIKVALNKRDANCRRKQNKFLEIEKGGKRQRGEREREEKIVEKNISREASIRRNFRRNNLFPMYLTTDLKVNWRMMLAGSRYTKPIVPQDADK